MTEPNYEVYRILDVALVTWGGKNLLPGSLLGFLNPKQKEGFSQLLLDRTLVHAQ